MIPIGPMPTGPPQGPPSASEQEQAGDGSSEFATLLAASPTPAGNAAGGTAKPGGNGGSPEADEPLDHAVEAVTQSEAGIGTDRSGGLDEGVAAALAVAGDVAGAPVEGDEEDPEAGAPRRPSTLRLSSGQASSGRTGAGEAASQAASYPDATVAVGAGESPGSPRPEVVLVGAASQSGPAAVGHSGAGGGRALGFAEPAAVPQEPAAAASEVAPGTKQDLSTLTTEAGRASLERPSALGRDLNPAAKPAPVAGGGGPAPAPADAAAALGPGTGPARMESSPLGPSLAANTADAAATPGEGEAANGGRSAFGLRTVPAKAESFSEGQSFVADGSDAAGAEEPGSLEPSPRDSAAEAPMVRVPATAAPRAAEGTNGAVAPVNAPTEAGSVEGRGALVRPPTLAAPPNPVDQVIASVRLLRASGRQEIRLRLEPPDLGTVRVRVVEENGVLSVQLRAEQAAALEAIRQALPQLRQGLENAQVTLADLEAALDDEAAFSAHHRERDESGDEPNGRARLDADGEVESAVGVRVASDNLVDFRA